MLVDVHKSIIFYMSEHRRETKGKPLMNKIKILLDFKKIYDY